MAAPAPFRSRGSMLPLKLTMRPQRRSRIPPSSVWVRRRVAVKFRAQASSQAASSAVTESGRVPPALLTRMSTRPSPSSASRARRWTSSASVISATITSGFEWPAAAISSASSSRASRRRAVIASRTPSAARTRAMPAPMPMLAPVTKAVRSCSCRSMIDSPLQGRRVENGAAFSTRLAERSEVQHSATSPEPLASPITQMR